MGADPVVGGQPVVLGLTTLIRHRGRAGCTMVKASERVWRSEREAVERVAGGRLHSGVNFSVDVDPQ